MTNVATHSASRYRALALSPNTLRSYASDIRRFKASGGTIPATPRMVASYLARNATKLRPSTLMRRLAAITYEHVRRRLRSPTDSPVVRQTLRGILRTLGQTQRQARPVTTSTLQKITSNLPGYSRLRNARDRALLLLGFAGGFRRSELARLRWGDVAFSARGVTLRLRSSKTDPYSRGREVAVPKAKNPRLCAVKALQEWSTRFSDASLGAPSQETPLFARIDRYDRPHPGLSAHSVNTILQRRMQSAGLDRTGYSAHSLRAGLVTSAACAGVPLWAIQRQTGHRSVGSVLRYVRDIPIFKFNAVRQIL